MAEAQEKLRMFTDQVILSLACSLKLGANTFSINIWVGRIPADCMAEAQERLEQGVMEVASPVIR